MAGSEYYDHTTYPATGAAGASSTLRAELDLIEAGFGKLPTFVSNGNKVIRINTGATAMDVGSILDNGTDVSITGDLTVAGGHLGIDAGSLHALPDVAADTFTLNDATQTLTNKTFSFSSNTVAGLLIGTYGGTGVNNSTRTLTYAGNVAFTGAYNVSFTVPAANTYVLPEIGCDLASEQLQQNSKSAAYTCVASDAGKQIFHPSADTTARIFTIPANASVAYPIGTAITFINQNSAGTLTIAITSDTMRLAGFGTTGSRTLVSDGIATAVKVTSTEWIISGVGLT